MQSEGYILHSPGELLTEKWKFERINFCIENVQIKRADLSFKFFNYFLTYQSEGIKGWKQFKKN